jgi:2-(1,2-epoxy-1,2-dihydrophenyl)acetyl-CoA isomerase
MSAQLIADLALATEQVAADPSVRAVLLRAEGKNFCVGGDIKAFAAEPDPSDFIERLAGTLHESLLRLAAIDAPLVIAVRGAAAGAGISLASAGDIVIGGESSSYSMAYSSIGLTADGGATWLLPRLVGLRLVQEMALLNRRLSAEEAVRFGLITRSVPDEDVEAEALALAQQIAAGPTRAFGGIKRLLAAAQTATLPDHLAAEAKAIGVAMATDDAQGAIRAFLDRAKPEFHGR